MRLFDLADPAVDCTGKRTLFIAEQFVVYLRIMYAIRSYYGMTCACVGRVTDDGRLKSYNFV